jgi:hypothetical protein
MDTTLEQPLAQITIGELVILIEKIVEAKLAPQQEPASLTRRMELRAALKRECRRLDPDEEQTWAEMGMSEELALVVEGLNAIIGD